MPTWQESVPLLVPEAYRESVRLVEYLESIGEWMDEFPQTKSQELISLLNPDTVPIAFVQYLADLIHLQISQFLGSEDYKLRRQLQQAVDWYKIKGTYRSFNVIFYTVELTGSVWDLYTQDYVNFSRAPWYCDGIGGMTPGLPYFDTGLYLDESNGMDLFYKSPHFDIVINLDHFILNGEIEYLLSYGQWQELLSRVEEVRPANTVPHYYLLLAAQTDQQLIPYNDPISDISLCVTNKWEVDAQWFDVGLYLDESHIVDWDFAWFLSKLTKFKIGSGRRRWGTISDASPIQTDLVNPYILLGSIEYTAVFADRVEIALTIPSGDEYELISELGIFGDDGAQYIDCVLPDIYKPAGVPLSIVLTVMFNNTPR